MTALPFNLREEKSGMNFDIICFDFDSTLSAIEGIDALAERAGCGLQMAELTQAAMNGEVALEDVYAQRLELIRPNKAAIEWLANEYIDNQVVGVEAVFQALQAADKTVHIISGGLKPALLPLAKRLGINENQVHAVDVLWDDQGDYKGFQRESPLARNGGKAIVCEQLNPKKLSLAMVGDGKTDMEAKSVGAYCIGFGGVVARPIVQEQADIFIIEKDLRVLLAYLL